MAKNLVERDKKGRFVKSGNPKGRPEGSKNKITLLKHSLELALREQAAPDIGEVLNKAIELAKAGDTTMIKLLLELHMSKGHFDSNPLAGREKVTINIKGPDSNEREEKGFIIDGEASSTGSTPR